jgi:GT2 family glycosyltransferase
VQLREGGIVRRKRLAVIIVNYRTPELTSNGVESVLHQLDPTSDHCLIVDNGSGDDSVSVLKRHLLGTHHDAPLSIRSATENRGFSAGVNIGLRAIDADRYLVLNSDVIVREGAISALVRASEAHSKPTLVGPTLEDTQGAPQVSSFPYPGFRGELVDAAATGPITRLLSRPSASRWVSFAAVLISRSALDAAGYLDEGFFMYYEDVDYCRRIEQAGGLIIDCPEARIAHLRGASSPVKSLRKERKRMPAYFYESRSRYFAKHHGRLALWMANIFWTLGQTIAAIREVAGRPRHNARGATRDIWRGALKPTQICGGEHVTA